MLRKAGIADTEFTNPGGGGRVEFYQDNGALIDGSTPPASSLVGNGATLARYDLVLFECVGAQVAKAAADQQRVIAFANAGGRVFATHYSYVWLTDSDGTSSSNTGPTPFSETASWPVNQGEYDNVPALVDETLQGDAATQARRIAFASWLKLVGASTTLGQLTLQTVRHDLDAVSATRLERRSERPLWALLPIVSRILVGDAHAGNDFGRNCLNLLRPCTIAL